MLPIILAVGERLFYRWSIYLSTKITQPPPSYFSFFLVFTPFVYILIKYQLARLPAPPPTSSPQPRQHCRSLFYINFRTCEKSRYGNNYAALIPLVVQKGTYLTATDKYVRDITIRRREINLDHLCAAGITLNSIKTRVGRPTAVGQCRSRRSVYSK